MAFKTLGAKRYPMHMTSTVATENMPPANIEANVETLENVTKFDGDPFYAAGGSGCARLVFDTCCGAVARRLRSAFVPAGGVEEPD